GHRGHQHFDRHGREFLFRSREAGAHSGICAPRRAACSPRNETGSGPRSNQPLSRRTSMTHRLSASARLMLAIVVAISLSLPTIGVASSGQSKGSTKSAGTGSGQKTVHVRGYTKKDGTKVDTYDRKAAESKTNGRAGSVESEAGSRARVETPRVPPAPIYSGAAATRPKTI